MSLERRTISASEPSTSRRPSPRVEPPAPRVLALRERAILRLAARQGSVAVVLRRDGCVAAGAADRLELLADLGERGLLRYGGLRRAGAETRIVYEL